MSRPTRQQERDAVAHAIAKTDWRAVVGDRDKTILDLKDVIEQQIAEVAEHRKRLTDMRDERDRWREAHGRADKERDQESQARQHAYHEATNHARRADFWKGVAMGFDPVRATAIEERQNNRKEPMRGGDLMSVMSKEWSR